MSTELALPAEGAEPPCQRGVTALPSIWNTVGRYAVAPLVTPNATVIEYPTSSIELNVVLELPRKLNVQFADELLV